MKLLILIVAYNHEKEIESVLARIPDAVSCHDTEILILDDSSQDQTFEISSKYARDDKFPFKVKALYNPVNQGYGGNQKIGYHYAIENDFDVVALVHGDGQYAPEYLPELLEPFEQDGVDAVFGSRMIKKGGAIQGGMPLYKFVGNKILTRFQNTVLGSSLSEFHTGYRLYKVDALRSVPFQLNTNDFHFDTEIIIQFLRAGLNIKELPISTFYGEEICNVNGMKYAGDVFVTTLVARCQNFGILYDSKYDVSSDEDGPTQAQSKLLYESSHRMAVDAVAPNSRVLIVGNSSIFIGDALRQKGCHVLSVDSNTASGEHADEFIQLDINTAPFDLELDQFDVVLLLDCLAQLSNPEGFVQQLATKAGRLPNLELVVTTGNVGFGIVRLMLFFGWFHHSKRGILDKSHHRLFTFASLERLFVRNGFDLLESKGIPGPFPLSMGDNLLARSLLKLNAICMHISKGFFGYQTFLRLKPRPSLAWLLERAHDRVD